MTEHAHSTFKSSAGVNWSASFSARAVA